MRRFLILNITLSAIFIAGLIWGPALLPFIKDKTYMTWGISLFFICGLIYSMIAVLTGEVLYWNRVRWFEEKIVFLGLLGTVVGLIIAFVSIDPATIKNADMISPTVTILLQGIGTALYTTLVGAVGHLWLNFNRRLLGA